MRYPIYIISKGRHDSMQTSRTLADLKIYHYIAIEPQDETLYREALVKFNINPFATLLILPFANHGDGPGRARNWCWEHSKKDGFKRHWVLDDNIRHFYRLHNNQKIRVKTDAIFNAAEDFVDRYKNVPVSGFQYRFFVAPDHKYPPYVANTRIYSCLLIENDCEFKWRGRYNEDTDLCLRVLKAGLCTIQFNAFLQGKSATQTVKGGNTAEFYHKEFMEDKGEDVSYNPDGTILKSKMLVDMHPDVARMVWRYGRWHHHVDYSKFKSNKLEYVDGFILPEGQNEYGMKLVPRT